MRGRRKVEARYTRHSILGAGAGLGLVAGLSPLMFGNERAMAETEEGLAISPLHLACIRQLRFIWVPNVESGGPSVDFEAPFGSPEAYNDLASISKIKFMWDLKRLYEAVMVRLEVFTDKARLAPGTYVLQPELVRRLEQFMTGGQNSIASDGSFAFTTEHAKLIAAFRWAYPEPRRLSFVYSLILGQQAASGAWRVPCANFKRPFGDMSYFEIDMAEILGVPFKPNTKDPEGERLFALYQQMHVALQVFVMNATL